MYSCKILSGDKLKFEPEQGDYLSKKKTCKNNGEEDDFSNMPWKMKRWKMRIQFLHGKDEVIGQCVLL